MLLISEAELQSPKCPILKKSLDVTSGCLRHSNTQEGLTNPQSFALQNSIRATWPPSAGVKALGVRHSLRPNEIATLIDAGRAAVAHWPTLARATGVSATSMRLIADAHARVWNEFESF